MIREEITRLLVAEVCSDSAQNGWRYLVNLILAHQTQWHSVAQFRIHARQPGLRDGRRIVPAAAALTRAGWGSPLALHGNSAARRSLRKVEVAAQLENSYRRA